MSAYKSFLHMVYSIFVLLLGGVMNGAQTFDELLPLEKQDSCDESSFLKVQEVNTPILIAADEMKNAEISAPCEESAKSGTKKRKNKAKKNKKAANADQAAAATNVSISPLLTPRCTSPSVEVVDLVAAVEKSLATQANATTATATSTESSPKKQQQKKENNKKKEQKQQLEAKAVKATATVAPAVELYSKSVLKRACPGLKETVAVTKQQAVDFTSVRPVRQPTTPPALNARGFSQQYRQSRSLAQQWERRADKGVIEEHIQLQYNNIYSKHIIVLFMAQLFFLKRVICEACT